MLMSRIAPFALLLALSGYAQTQPNFTGTWKLNVAKSDFGMLPAPASRVDVITQTADMIKDDVNAESDQGKVAYVANLKFDGSETVVHAMGRDIKTTAKWEGSTLVTTQKFDYEGAEINVKNSWTMAPDGNTFTINVHLASPMGEMDQKQVFEKQSGGASSTASTAPAAGGKPNFSGVWKLNVDKSDFVMIPPTESETDTIEHNDPKLKLAVSQVGAQGKQDYQLDLAIDGKEQTHKMGTREVKTTANW